MGCAGFNSDIRLLLRRLSSTESDHRAGDRLTPEALHSLLELDSAAVAAKPVREAIVLFDDVITTGKSFKCCERRLREVDSSDHADHRIVCGATHSSKSLR